MPAYFMVFDVESLGLHGPAFAVGFVVVDANGAEVASGKWKYNPDKIAATVESRQWVADNCPWAFDGSDGGVDSAKGLRDGFWNYWSYWKSAGAVLAADVPWPVEANFLSACIADAPEVRAWQGPYPLIDVASVRLAAGLDPLGTEERRVGELPAHDPLADARQSARLLIEALAVMGSGRRKMIWSRYGHRPHAKVKIQSEGA